MSSKIEFFGLAANWSVFTPQSGHRAKFGHAAFDRFASRTESSYLRLWVEHLADFQLTRAGQIHWSVDHIGVWCRFAIERATGLDRAVCTAIEYGWLPGLSVHFDHHLPSTEMSDAGGPYRLISEIGFMRELSIVHEPGCKAAFVERFDGISQTPRTFPTDLTERSRLVSLLRDLDIDHEAAKTPVKKPVKAAAKLISEPIVHMSTIRKAKASHPPGFNPNKPAKRRSIAGVQQSADDFFGDLHTDWIRTNRYQEWLKNEELKKKSPTGAVTLITD